MFSDIVKEEYRKIFLHGDMALSRLMLYAQSIEEFRLYRRSKDAKRGRTDEQGQPRFKKRAPNQDVPNAPKADYEKGGGSQIDKPTCSNYGKKHFVKYLAGINGCLVMGSMITR